MMEYQLSQSSKLLGMPIIRFTLISFFIVATVVCFGARSYLRLYGYAPWIFATSPRPPHSQLIWKDTIVDRECHEISIVGIYSTNTSWDEVIAFYKSNGFRAGSSSHQYGKESFDLPEGRLRRYVQKINAVGPAVGEHADVNAAMRAALSSSQNVYEFNLWCIEDKEGHAECRRRRE
jgi:hypothetical protein